MPHACSSGDQLTYVRVGIEKRNALAADAQRARARDALIGDRIETKEA